MTTQEQLDRKRQEYAELRQQIAGMEPGAVRQEMKRRANGLTGEIVSLRQDLIKAELASEKPQHVPRVTFDGQDVERQKKE